MSKKSLHVAVVGGGAAGMMAAITARRHGADVTLLERQDRVGRKILVTGNSRCNLTNAACTAANYHGADPGFVAPVLEQLPVDETIAFFDALGVCTVEEDAGRIFPLTGQASTVLDVLRYELEQAGVAVQLTAPIKSISREGERFVLRWSRGELQAERVIVATGGRAMPQVGGNESGLALLADLGHTVLPQYPALVPLKSSSHACRQLHGIKVQAEALLFVNGRPAASDRGEILFTDYGLSGPPIIQLSVPANAARQSGHEVSIALDLFPCWPSERLRGELDRRLNRRPAASLEFALVGLLHKRLIPVVLHQAGVSDIHQAAGGLPAGEVERLVEVLTSWPFAITGSLSFSEAHVMAGGVATVDFSPQTLESRLVTGLFAAGEVLDITGDCGGYNLQWAWSSGYVAGLHAARGAA